MAHQASVLTARPDLVVDDIDPSRRAPAPPPSRRRPPAPAVPVVPAGRAGGRGAGCLRPRPGFGPWPTIQGGSALERVFAQWDGAWYLWVAGHGYPSSSQYYHHLSDVAFFPVFPATRAGRVVHDAVVDAARSRGLVLRAGRGCHRRRLAARRASRRQGEGDAGDGSVRVLPRRVRAVDGLRRDVDDPCRGGLSAVPARSPMGPGRCVGFIATATRPNGVAVLIACAVVAFVEIRRRRDWSALAAPGIAACGVFRSSRISGCARATSPHGSNRNG